MINDCNMKIAFNPDKNYLFNLIFKFLSGDFILLDGLEIF